MKTKNYIGITGFKSKKDVQDVRQLLEAKDLPKKDYTVMFGFLTSSKRLADPTNPGSRGPPVNKLAELTSYVPGWGLPMLHYFTPEKENMVQEVTRLFNQDDMYAQGFCRAIQLNMDWPELSGLDEIKSRFPELTVLMQMPSRAVDNMSLDQIHARAKDYAGKVEYVLVDPSGGKGIDSSIPDNVPLISTLADALPHTKVGFAGGIKPMNAREKMRQLSEYFGTRFFVDAESGLMEDNKLRLGAIDNYVSEAMRVLR